MWKADTRILKGTVVWVLLVCRQTFYLSQLPKHITLSYNSIRIGSHYDDFEPNRRRKGVKYEFPRLFPKAVEIELHFRKFSAQNILSLVSSFLLKNILFYLID